MARDSKKNDGSTHRRIPNRNRAPRREEPEMDRCDSCRKEVYADMLTFVSGKGFVCGQCL